MIFRLKPGGLRKSPTGYQNMIIEYTFRNVCKVVEYYPVFLTTLFMGRGWVWWRWRCGLLCVVCVSICSFPCFVLFAFVWCCDGWFSSDILFALRFVLHYIVLSDGIWSIMRLYVMVFFRFGTLCTWVGMVFNEIK